MIIKKGVIKLRIILLEGQPGSGKSTLSKNLYEKLVQRHVKCVIIDENKQDTEVFGDYWDNFNKPSEEVIASFVKSWEVFLSTVDKESVVIMDNALLNQVQYLLSINTSTEDITDFFNKIIYVFKIAKVEMIFFDGNSDIIIRRVNQVRKNGWGERVANLLESAPYQKARNREGLVGMIKFFSDSQNLKRKVLLNWVYPKVEIDVTNEDWDEYEESVSNFVFNRH